MTLPSTRDLSIDVVRALAVLSMFIAHVAPSSGPLGVLEMSEFLTFPLFGLLVGVGSQLASTRTTFLGHLVGSLIRGGALILIGALLELADSQVLIVLVPLGVLTVLTAFVTRLPTAAVVVLGLASGVLAPMLVRGGAEMMVAHRDNAVVRQVLSAVVNPTYPIPVLLMVACVGMVIARYVGSGERASVSKRLLIAGLLALTPTAAIALAGHREMITLEAYRTVALEVFFVLLLSTGTTLAVLGLARMLPDPVVQPIAWVGEITLTIYVVHVLWLSYYEHNINFNDNNWTNLLVLTAGALVLAVGWRMLRLPRPWTRGPLEGMIAAAVALVPAERRAPDLTHP